MIRMQMTMEVNGVARTLVVEPRTTLVDALRDELGLTAAKSACDEGVCGACTVLVDGEPVLACLMFAAQAHGREVVTAEGLERDGQLHPVQQALVAGGATGCGYCTPGTAMLAAGAFSREAEVADGDLPALFAGNLCRCNGYGAVIAAAGAAQTAMRAQGE